MHRTCKEIHRKSKEKHRKSNEMHMESKENHRRRKGSRAAAATGVAFLEGGSDPGPLRVLNRGGRDVY